MRLSVLAGQPVATQILNSSLQNGRISHAYLFAGPDGTGKSVCADEFARLIVGDSHLREHPDIIVVEPEGASVKIDQARRIQRELSLRPVYGSRRVVIVKHAGKMTDEAANSLLKTLEDPPQTAVLILLVTHAHALLPTIVSRCQLIPFRPSGTADVETFLIGIGVEPKRAKTCATLSGGIIGTAIMLSEQKAMSKPRESALNCVDGIQSQDAWSLAAEVGTERQEVIESLAFLATLFRDALAVVSKANEELIINADAMQSIGKLSEFSPASLAISIQQIMRAMARLERNCHVQSTLDLLFLRIKSALIDSSRR